MKITKMLCAAILLISSASWLRAQELTAAQVLAKLDEKAKAFTSLEASLSKEEVVYETKQPPQTGKIYLKTTPKKGPYVFLDIDQPKTQATKALVKEGKMTAYFVAANNYQQGKVDPNSDFLQLLLIGWGVPSSTFTKFYTPRLTGRETIEQIRSVVLELTATSAQTAKFAKITLWLDPNTWTPLQTRLTEKSKDYFDFKYSKVKLNKGVSDSVFNINIPKNAKKQ